MLILMSWLMKRKSSSRRSSRGWHQKPFHATGQGGRSTDGQKGASAQPGLASPQLRGTNEQSTAETGGQSTVLWYSPSGRDGAVIARAYERWTVQSATFRPSSSRPTTPAAGLC